MNHYRFVPKDQTKPSWVLFELVKSLPKRPKRPELPPVFYQFFGPIPEGEMRLKSLYEKFVCKTCGRYDTYQVFEGGFGEPVTIRIKGGFGDTDDCVFVINDRFLKVLKGAKVRGYESKPIGKSGWHALRATVLVDCDESVVTTKGHNCRECGRPEKAFGLFHGSTQLSIPGETNTFFTTKKSWPYPTGVGRDVYCTEDVAKALKAGGIKGGWCNRLLSDDELKKLETSPSWKPPNQGVTL